MASGDLRPAANAAGWPAQEALEKAVTAAFGDLGWSVRRAHDVDPDKRHGFVDSQRRGLEVFATIPQDAADPRQRRRGRPRLARKTPE